ncbi:MAG: outer membrane beta-barrel protein [Chlamydiae bacterium]|nr:outer membrane beta-barrel protein [Chlamydiota bacterium]
MKYYLFLFLLICFASKGFSDQCKNKSDKISMKGSILEIKPAYFHFQDPHLRSIFGNSAFMITGEYDHSLSNRLHIYADASYLQKEGTLHKYKTDAIITLIPLSIGLKYIYPYMSHLFFYGKAGPNWFYLRAKQQYPFVKEVDTKNGFGATLGTGSLIFISKTFFFDLFVNYLYDKKTFLDPNSNFNIKMYAGGFEVGLGFDAKF